MMVGLVVTTGCGPVPAAQWREPRGTITSGVVAVPPASQLVVYPAANARNVSPADPVTVNLIDGALDSVTLRDSAGRSARGELSADRSIWHATEDLDYHKTYTLAIMGRGGDGKVYEQTNTFTTVQPRSYAVPTLLAYRGECAVPDDHQQCLASAPQRKLDGGTFGVGQLIIVTFD